MAREHEIREQMRQMPEGLPCFFPEGVFVKVVDMVVHAQPTAHLRRRPEDGLEGQEVQFNG